MPNQAFIDLLTRTLNAGSLPHPGDENRPPYVIPLPGFRGAGMSDEQAQELIGQAAKNWAEALAHVIETAGLVVIPNTELEQLRQDAADAPDGTRIITLWDRSDTQRQQPLLSLTVGKTDDVTVDRKLLQRLAN